MKKIGSAVGGLVVIIGMAISFSGKTAVKPTVKHKPIYVALGDSVAAGVGLKTDLDASACARTTESYPVLLSKQLDMTLLDYACSGASIGQGLTGAQNLSGASLEPQISQLYTSVKPALVTITIGANDVDWLQTILKCYSAKCGTSTDTTNLSVKLQAMQTNLKSVLEGIKQHYSSSPPKIVLTGYYQLFPSSYQACSELTNIDNNELGWVRGQVTQLNQSIAASVIGYSFARYVEINFTGHELCSSQPWIQGLSESVAFHPNSDGQSAIASAIATN